MKTINRALPFTSKTEWAWPDEDEKLLQVFEHVSDINLTMQHIAEPVVVVQAGGACGVWPLRYSQLFERVYTFEPMPANRECLIKNIEGCENIEVLPHALSDKSDVGCMVFDRSEQNNYGAVYFKSGQGNVTTSTIDALNLDRCDLIQLDIEGHELQALKGAAETINKYSPIIVLEEKPLIQLQHDFQEPRRFIESMGYVEIDRIHRDVIFKRSPL